METRRDVFQAIADPVRRDILNMLTHKQLNLNSIAENFDISRPAISQHIKILTECGLVVIDQQGRERYCYLQPKKMSEVSEWLEPFRKLWQERHNRLDGLLENLKAADKTKNKKMKVMKAKNETQIIADQGQQDVYIIREFDAPRELVFKAHADPKLIKQWLGPKERVMKIDYYNSKSGGAYRYTIEDKKGREIAAFNGVIHEVTAPERIIQTFEFEGLPQRGHVTLDCMTFEALPGNRTKVTTHSVCRTKSDRDAMMASGMESGVNEGYEKLDEILKTLA